ncbi:MAG TPA: pyridoxamine 5'-phosphate oxidase [Euzebya sp.]|nr:pyridoxamine 5'-phosphate oxidase [Euzebya sp.]
MSPDPVKVRMDYGDHDLDATDLDENPIVQLQRWMEEASLTDQLVEPSAAALATVDAEGRPSLRTVLVRRITHGQLLFFSNYSSRKAVEIQGNPHVALLFRWAGPQRQVEVLGRAGRASPAIADAYFAGRPRDSQIGAHASPQSRPLADRQALDAMMAAASASLEGVDPIPRPEDWGGFAVTPYAVEFWQGRSSRLHDRIRYDLQPDATWTRTRLAP